LISPWIPKGLVISGPPAAQKPANNSEYDLTSIIATTRKLLGMRSGPLTKRDAWSASFEQALSLRQPRRDCPVHLPAAPPPSHSFAPEKEALLPLNDLQEHIISVHSHLSGVKLPEHLQRQGHVSEWAQKQYRRHADRTTQWKESKQGATYALVCRPIASSNWVDASWDVNSGRTVSFNTVSLRDVSTMCLDYGTGRPRVGGLVNVAACYPSSHPDTNRDAAQQWIWGKDSTVRPAADRSLCLTTALLEGDMRMYLRPCAGKVEQHFAWHGPGAGESDGGWIFFGDDTNALGIVNATIVTPL